MINLKTYEQAVELARKMKHDLGLLNSQEYVDFIEKKTADQRLRIVKDEQHKLVQMISETRKQLL